MRTLRALLPKRGVRLLWLLLTTPIAASPAVAAEVSDRGATDVLYFTAADWQNSTPERKLALSAAFMRIFCTDIRMPPERLVTCLDTDGRADEVFERAIACSIALSRS